MTRAALRLPAGALAWLALIAVARADEPPDAALLLQDEGIALYESGDFAAARDRFDQACALAPDKKNPHRWLGLAEARLGQCAEAVREFGRFLALAEAGDKRIPEVVRERYRCQAILDGGAGVLAIESEPPGAVVKLDGAAGPPAGTTPFRAELPVGERDVELSGIGPTRKEHVSIRAGETTSLALRLLVPEVPSATSRRRAPLYRRWWLWTALGAAVAVAVAVGVGVGVGVAAARPAEPLFNPIPVHQP